MSVCAYFNSYILSITHKLLTKLNLITGLQLLFTVPAFTKSKDEGIKIQLDI